MLARETLIEETGTSPSRSSVAVVIPCYKVRAHILAVLDQIGPEPESIYVIDDCCPDHSGRLVEEAATDPRIKVLYNSSNLGVGGATLVGMRQAASDGHGIAVKVDGDGQMDPAMIPGFVSVIQSGEADYTKGNRFFEAAGVRSMPKVRLFGNAALSFLAKLSTGYWHSFDPTNGYIAIHTSVLEILPEDKIAKRYFFESDLLFHLNLVSARVIDVPIHAFYGDEVSNLSPMREVPRFAAAHLRNMCKRIAYTYFLRDFNLASVELVCGMILLFFGGVYGIANWGGDVPATAGTVMLSALPILIGFQMLLSFLNYDIQSTPRVALHPRLRRSGQIRRAMKHRDRLKKASEKSEL